MECSKISDDLKKILNNNHNNDLGVIKYFTQESASLINSIILFDIIKYFEQ